MFLNKYFDDKRDKLKWWDVVLINSIIKNEKTLIENQQEYIIK
jgi:hypothetical protein